jgi:uncharacterized protein YndB with AHSA1/START domain
VERLTELLPVRCEIEIDASPETVWGFLANPEKARLWWGALVELELTPGGRIRVEVVPGRVVSGAFVEIDPPRRLVYTFGWEQPPMGAGPVGPGSTTVEIDLIPVGAATRLRLLHRDLPGPESAAAHEQGWDHYLGRLAVVAGGGDPGPDPWREGTT